jgi:hypothetical protein
MVLVAGACGASALVLVIGNAPPVPNAKGTKKKRPNLLVTNDLHNSRDTHPPRCACGKMPTDVALFPHSRHSRPGLRVTWSKTRTARFASNETRPSNRRALSNEAGRHEIARGQNPPHQDALPA